MSKTLFVLPAVERSTLSCVWIYTGDPAQPLACVWIDRDLHIARTDAFIGCEVSEPAGQMEGNSSEVFWVDQHVERKKP
jgi:hypothetical protein